MSEPTYPTPRQRRLLWNALTAVAAMSLLLVAALTFYGFISFLSWSYPVLLPIGLAVIVALVLDPVVNFVQKRGVSREISTLLVCTLAVIAFIIFWIALGNTIYNQSSDFVKDLPTLVGKGVAQVEAKMSSLAKPAPRNPLLLRPESVPPLLPAATNQLSVAEPPPPEKLTLPMAQPEEATEVNHEKGANEEIQAWLKTNLPIMLESLQKNLATFVYNSLGPVGQAFGFLLGFGFVPIYVYYFLADRDHLSAHWHELVPMRQSKLREEVVSVLNEINQSLVSYFRGQIIVAGCNGVLTWIGLSIIGIPNSLLLGIVTGALSIVPFLGIICSIIPALLLGFVSAQGDPTLQWLRPLLVLVVFTVVQASESTFITPRVQSHSTGLHPLAIIIGILFWSMLLPGLLGPIVAVPLTCAVVVILRRYVWQAEKSD